MKYLLTLALLSAPLFACPDHDESAALELKQGDVLTEVNGLPMDTEEHAVNGMQQIGHNPKTMVKKSKLQVSATAPKPAEKQN